MISRTMGGRSIRRAMRTPGQKGRLTEFMCAGFLHTVRISTAEVIVSSEMSHELS